MPTATVVWSSPTGWKITTDASGKVYSVVDPSGNIQWSGPQGGAYKWIVDHGGVPAQGNAPGQTNAGITLPAMIWAFTKGWYVRGDAGEKTYSVYDPTNTKKFTGNWLACVQWLAANGDPKAKLMASHQVQ